MPLLMDDQCECAIPFLWETHSPFLGRAVRMRLCCIAKFLEDYFEVSFQQTWDSQPLCEWNGEGEMPGWMKRRLEAKKAAGEPVDPIFSMDKLREEVERHGAEDVISHIIKSGDYMQQESRKAWSRDGRHA